MTVPGVETLFNTADIKRFYFPGRLMWGSGCREEVLRLVSATDTVLLLVDIAFVDDSFVERVEAKFGARLIGKEVVSRMPETQRIMALVESISSPPNVVISIGGGSTADTAKAAVAYWLYGSFDGIGMGKKRGIAPLEGHKKPLLIGLPTTAGTGADASRYYVTYDTNTRGKVHGKSFNVIADWILADPVFLDNMPARLLVSCAFDSFLHFFESLIARFERSAFGEMLSIDGIVRIVTALDAIFRRKCRSDSQHMELLYASITGGIAITNVRTGNIHEAAGAILELTDLSHPETLMIFFRSAYEHYKVEIVEQSDKVLGRLALALPEVGFAHFEDLIGWWEQLFAEVGLETRIAAAMKKVGENYQRVRAHVYERVATDAVWVDKESPRPLRGAELDRFIDTSLKRYLT